jgi:hypothetical protein
MLDLQCVPDDKGRLDGDPSLPGALTIAFRDGGSCQLDGTVPYLFGGDVPGMFGHYRCDDAAGGEVEQGVFGFRTTSQNKPFYNFSGQ